MTSPEASGPAAATPAAEAFDRYWDALTQPSPPAGWGHDPLLDDGLTRTVRRIQFANDAPVADTAFASRLWGELMASAGRPIGGATPLIGLPPRRLLLELLAAAALLMAVIGSGATFGLANPLKSGATTAVALAASDCSPGSAPVSTVTAAIAAVPVALPQSLVTGANGCLANVQAAVATPPR